MPGVQLNTPTAKPHDKEGLHIYHYKQDQPTPPTAAREREQPTYTRGEGMPAAAPYLNLRNGATNILKYLDTLSQSSETTKERVKPVRNSRLGTCLDRCPIRSTKGNKFRIEETENNHYYTYWKLQQSTGEILRVESTD
jgi:hypothetical protein